VTNPPRPQLNISAKLDTRLRGTLVARVQTAQLLKMGEPDIAKLIKEIESDPLFLKMLYPPKPDWKIVRFQPHPRTSLSHAFYELNDQLLPQDTPADVVQLLENRRGLREKIRGMGPEAFERYFLRADENLSPEEAGEACGLTPEEVRQVQDFLLEFSVHAEFFDRSSKSVPGIRVVRLGRVQMTDDDVFIEWNSPHLARGRYEIQYDRMEELIRKGLLAPEEKRHLKALIHRLELVNWRQSALYRIVYLLCYTQRDYLAQRDTMKRRSITQRRMARQLSVAPSTVNRAVQGRSLILPWGEELLLEELFCSRKELCLDALDALDAADKDFKDRTDNELRERLKKSLGFTVPRRTVNTYRRQLQSRSPSSSGSGEVP